jgi:flagellar biosynthesis/type III secretory pathway protein FliH
MGRVIKGFGRVVPGVVLDARAEAAALLRDARAEVERGRAELAAERDEARRQGAEEGRAQGLAEVAATLAAARARAQQTLEAAAPAAIALARKMAEMIVGRAVALAPETITDIAGAALESSRATSGVLTLRLHPDDLPHATARRDALAARAPAAADLRLVADESVGRHGCIVDTAEGRVDARLEIQLAALERALTEGTHG